MADASQTELLGGLMRKCGSAYFLALVLLLTTICPIPAHAVLGDDVPALQYFPLLKGNVWMYEGPVAWTIVNSGEVRRKELTIRMEITETYRRGLVWLALFRGHPFDGAWYEAGGVPSRGAYLCVGYRVYELDEPRTADVLRRLQDPKDGLANLVSEDELVFDFPLLPGKRFGDTKQLAREDGRYQWLVLPVSPTVAARELLNDTLPGHIRLQFEEGIGITRYEYVHHGTVSESHLTLVAFTPRTLREAPLRLEQHSGEAKNRHKSSFF